MREVRPLHCRVPDRAVWKRAWGGGLRMKSLREVTSSRAVSVPVTVSKGRIKLGIWKRQKGHLPVSDLSVK